jgi:hypothetical protein
MFETENTPLRPPLRQPEQAAPPADSQRPKPAPASNASKYARRKHPKRKAPPAKPPTEALIAAKEKAVRMAQELQEEFGQRLTREDYIRVARAFHSAVVPKRKPGRRPKAHVTAAYLDWKAGMRGVPLFQKHIPGWDGHHRYRKIGEQKALMDAIRSRSRRQHNAA